MKRLLILLIFVPGMLYAQYNLKQNNVWAFGDHYGLDFNSGTAVPITTSVVTLGASASVCDRNGQLLFYTQGDTVWNRNHQIMPNGAALIAPYVSNGAGVQAEQGQLIVPVINNPDQYYVFSIQTGYDYYFGLDPMACRLFYSVVDMTLDNGLGDVVAGQKDIPLDSGITCQKLIAVPGEHCNIWVITHSIMGNDFRVWEINSNGISQAPAISTTGNLSGGIAYVEGKLRISPSRTRLFAPSAFGMSLQEVGAELFDFDPATGTVSNPVLLDTSVICFAGCFSPDNSKLYTIGSDPSFTYMLLSQYDLSQPTVAGIIASKTVIDTSNTFNYVKDVKLGPDGKIYASMDEPGDTLSRIDFPNLAGTACGFNKKVIPLNLTGGLITAGNGCLPNEYVIPVPDTFSSASDSMLAAGGTLLQVPAGAMAYEWNDATTGNTLTANDTGVYWVTYYPDYCTVQTDTFRVHAPLGLLHIARENAIDIYPNPADQRFTLRIEGAGPVKGSLVIMDALGRVVRGETISASETSIYTGDLPGGMYLVRYTDASDLSLKLDTRLMIKNR